jgi:hypothetical protein
MTRRLLVRAICERRLVAFEHGGRHRVVEPHTLGFLDGVEELLAYQVGGTSGSGRLPDWRRFRVIEIAAPQLLDRRFGSRPSGSGRHASWDHVEAYVA